MLIFILLAAILICVLIARLVYFSDAEFMTKVLIFPLALSLAFGVWVYFWQISGKPLFIQPPEDFVFVHYEVSADGTKIYIWANDSVLGNRLYVVDYNLEMMISLKAAIHEQSQNGQSQNGQSFIIGKNRDGDLIFFVESIPDNQDYQEITKNGTDTTAD